MINRKTLISVLIVLGSTGVASAQSNTNSPYTRYGFGQLSDQSFGHNKAMGGIGYALRDGGHINPSNPASYTAVDSLAFIFDIGMSLKNSNFSEGNIKTNAKNASFDYIAMQFRLWKRMAMTFGFLPFSSVGYNLSSSNTLTSENGESSDVTQTTSYTGEGGLRQVFMGLGFKVLNNLSVGANISYLYGDVTHQTTAAFSNSADVTMVSNIASIKSYKLDFGLQYTQRLSKKDFLTLGLTYNMGHNLNSSMEKNIQMIEVTSSGNSVISSNSTLTQDGFSMPHIYGVGLAYNRPRKFMVEADYTFQQWAKAKYDGNENYYSNSSKIALGGEFIPNFLSKNYLNRIHYRAGVFYSTPYTKTYTTNGFVNGGKEYGASLGFGLPLHLYQRRSILNISGQYTHVAPKYAGMLSENRFQINIGLTFNEKWFMKWKVE